MVHVCVAHGVVKKEAPHLKHQSGTYHAKDAQWAAIVVFEQLMPETTDGHETMKQKRGKAGHLKKWFQKTHNFLFVCLFIFLL